MKTDKGKTKEQLIGELAEMRQRVAELESLETERKQAEEELRNFKTAADTAVFGLGIGTAEHLTYVNRSFAEMHGYSPDELIGQNYSMFYTKEQLPVINKLRERLSAGGSFIEEEVWHKKKDGTSFPTLMTGHAIRDDEGNPSLIVGTTIDITERRQADEELRQSEERYKAIFELGSDVGEAIIINQDMPGQIAAQPIFNDEWIRITGYNRDELLRMSYFDLIHPEQRDAAINRYHRRLQGEKISGPLELTIVRKDGTEIQIEATATLSSFRGQNATIVYARDITERKQAEEALQLRAYLLNNATDSIIAADLEGNIIYANDTACRARGYTKEEMLEMHLRDTVAPELLSLVPSRMQNIIEKGYFTFESEHKRKDGSTFPVEITSRNIKLGERTVILSSMRDITERKQAEEALRAAEQNFRNSLDDSPLGIRIVTFEGDLLYANQAILDIYGYHNLEELRDTLPSQRYTRQSYAEFLTRKRKRQQGKPIPADYEIDIVRKDGEIRHLSAFRKEVIWNGETQYQTLYQDITERKKAEAALAESQELYRAVMELGGRLGEAIVLLQDDERGVGMHVYMNDVWCDITGYSREELLDISMADLIHHKDRDAAIARYASRLSGEDIPDLFELSIIRKNGTEIPVEVTYAHSTYKGKSANVGFIREIAERKKTETALRQSEEFNSSVLRNSPNPVMVANSDTSIRYVNPALENLTGYSLDELVGQKVPRPWWPEEMYEKLKSDVKIAYRRGFRDLERCFQKKSGERFWVQITATPVIIDGKFHHFIDNWVDITERKQMEEEIIKNRDYLERLNDSLTDMVFEIKFPERTIRYINKAVETVLGYRPEECLGQSIEMLYPSPEVFREVGRRLHKGIERGDEITTSEHELKRKDGGIITVEGRTNYFREDGKVASAFSVVRDITERKQAEQRTKESEQRYISAEQVGNFGHFSRYLDTDRLVWSAGSYRIFGVDPNQWELTRENAYKIVHPQDLEKLRKANEKAGCGTKGLDTEFRIIRPDGKERVIHAVADVTLDNAGKPERLFGTMQDVTERNQMEEEVARFKTIASVAPYGVGIANTDGTMTYANEAFDLMHGYAPDEIVGQHFSILYTEEQLEAVEKLRKRCLKTGSFVGEEAWRKRKDGTTFPSSMSMLLVRDDKGEPLYISAVVIDITERRQLEEEQQRSARLESIGTLAGGIAHDFNNILTGILGNISLAKRHVEPKSKADDRLMEAEKASLRARDLTQQLLTFSRGGTPVKKIVSIAELIPDSAGFALRGSNVSGQFSLPDGLWQVEADEGQMHQVITNLVLNACEAMPEGGVLNISAENMVIKKKDVLPLPKGNYVAIAIEDHGVGISEGHLDRIFEPFFTTKQKGSGLGLATTYSIIRKHDGYITVESTPTIGTTFRIYLPASAKPAPEKEEAVAETPLRGRGKILVMDDEEMIREMLNQMLPPAGYEVELTKDGVEAIERYRQAKESGHPFDAVIIDLTVPGGMGGREAIKKLLEIDAGVKAIVSSGYATDPVMANYKEYGFTDIVTKPYSVGDVEKVLRNIINEKRRVKGRKSK